MIEPTLLIGANSERLYPQIKGDKVSRLLHFFLPLVAKGCVVVASLISGDPDLAKFGRRFLGEFGSHIWVCLVLASATSGQDESLIFNLEIGSWIAQRKKTMSWSHSGKPWLFSILATFEEGIHGSS